MGRKPTAYELVKFVKADFVRSKLDGDFTTADAFEYLKDFEPSRRRLAGEHGFLNGVIGNVRNSVRSDPVARDSVVRHEMQVLGARLKRKPQPWELVSFIRTRVSPRITNTEAFEYLKDFEPQPRRRLAGEHDFLHGVIGGVRNSVRPDAVRHQMKVLGARLKRKPQPWELVSFARTKVSPPITKTEAFEYLKDFEPSRRRLAGEHGFLNGVIGNVRNSVRSDPVARDSVVRQEMQVLGARLKRKPQPWELVSFIRTRVSPPITNTEAFEYLNDFEPQPRWRTWFPKRSYRQRSQ